MDSSFQELKAAILHDMMIIFYEIYKINFPHPQYAARAVLATFESLTLGWFSEDAPLVGFYVYLWLCIIKDSESPIGLFIIAYAVAYAPL